MGVTEGSDRSAQSRYPPCPSDSMLTHRRALIIVRLNLAQIVPYLKKDYIQSSP